MESWVGRGRIPKIWEEKGEGLSRKVERKQKAGRKAKLIEVIKTGEREREARGKGGDAKPEKQLLRLLCVFSGEGRTVGVAATGSSAIPE